MKTITKVLLALLLLLILSGCGNDDAYDEQYYNYSALIMNSDQEVDRKLTDIKSPGYFFYYKDNGYDDISRILVNDGSRLRKYSLSGYELDYILGTRAPWTKPDEFSVSDDHEKICYIDNSRIYSIELDDGASTLISDYYSNDDKILWPFYNFDGTEVIYQKREGALRKLIARNIETEEERVVYENSRFVFTHCKAVSENLVLGKLYDYGRNTVFGKLAALDLESGEFEILTTETISFYDYHAGTSRLAYYTPGKELVVARLITSEGVFLGEELHRREIEEMVDGVSFPKFYNEGNNIIIDNYLIDLMHFEDVVLTRDFLSQPAITENGENILGVVYEYHN